MKSAYKDGIKILQNNEYVVLDSNGNRKYKKKYISKNCKSKPNPFKNYNNNNSKTLIIYDIDGCQIAEKDFLYLKEISNGIYEAHDKYYESSSIDYKKFWGYINKYGKWIWKSE